MYMRALPYEEFCLIFLVASLNFNYAYGNYGLRPGIPIGVIYDETVTEQTVNLVNIAIESINDKFSYGRNIWSVKISIINTDDTQLLINTICDHMSRGSLAIFGSTKLTSMETVKSMTDKYNIPFFSWSFFVQNKEEINQRFNQQIVNKVQIQIGTSENDTIKLSKRGVNFQPANYEKGEYENSDYSKSILYFKNKNKRISREPRQLYLRPNIAPVLIETIKYYRWKSVFYLYNYEQGKMNLQTLMEYQLLNQKYLITNVLEELNVRKINNVRKCREMLRIINSITDSKNITIIIDLDTKEDFRILLDQIKDLGMTGNRYHFVLTHLGINEINLNDFRYGGVTITGFSIIDYYSINTIKIISDLIEKDKPLNEINLVPYEAALIIDGLSYFIQKIDSIVGVDMNRLFGMDGVISYHNEIYINQKKGVICRMGMNRTDRWQLGSFILNQIKMKDSQVYEGLTGPISFDSNGNRNKIKINIYNLELNSRLSKIGLYSSKYGLRLNEKKSMDHNSKSNKSRKKKIVISVLDEPFFMIRPPEEGKNFTGNDQYMGYCVDLTKKLAELIGFSYEIRPVRDRKFGIQDAEGRWDGMVGELVRHEADFAVAPLTISTQRERAIEFSMPFMNMGISIMINKPKKEKPGVFSFMTPLDSSVWVCTLIGYLGVSLIMYLICRFSPFEWHTDQDGNLNNDFDLRNTLWFNLAALLQQGADFAPKSLSARVVASAWWFFTLILISSYTANLAAFLTVENMVNPIDSAEDLIKQTEIKFGVLEGGSTSAFFKNSKVKTYQEMWRFMNSWGPSVFVKSNYEGSQKVRNSSGKYAYLLESSVNEYLNERKPCNTIKVGSNLDSKGYGIATPIMSELSEPINLAILQLMEDGFLTELKSKWWYDRSECGGTQSSGDSSKTPLNLVNVAGVFYILMLGLILSVVIASLELVYKARVQSHKEEIQLSNAIKSRIRLSISGYEDPISECKSNDGSVIGEKPNRPGFDNSDLNESKNLKEKKTLL